jgi:hypothetical protein
MRDDDDRRQPDYNRTNERRLLKMKKFKETDGSSSPRDKETGAQRDRRQGEGRGEERNCLAGHEKVKLPLVTSCVSCGSCVFKVTGNEGWGTETCWGEDLRAHQTGLAGGVTVRS